MRDISSISKDFQSKLSLKKELNIVIKPFQENDINLMIDLCNQELSEPYSIYTYRHLLFDDNGLCYFVLL